MVWAVACVLIVVVGIMAGRGITSKQWTGGDRSMGPVAVGCVLAATQIGGMSVVGAAQNGYVGGISASWYSIASGVFLLVFAALANVLRNRMPSEKVPDYFEKRFGVASSRLYTYAWLVMGFIYIPIQLKTIAGIIQIVIPSLNVHLAVVVGLTLAALYTGIAGMKGSSIIGKITCFGTYILLAVFLATKLGQFGGYSGLVAQLPATHADWMNGYSFARIFSMMLGGTLGGLVFQTFMQAFLAAKDEKTAATGSVLGYVLAAPISVLCGIVGMMALAGNKELGNGSTAFAWAINEYASPLFGGLILALATMIIVATVAAMILACGTMLNKVYTTQINPKADEAKSLKFTRIASIVFAYATLIAAFAIPSASLTSMFLALVYSMTTPFSFSLLGGVFWKGASKAGSIASIVCGLITGICWQVFSLGYIMESVYAIFIVTFVVGIVVSLVCKDKEPQQA